jgi:hypothetical protein
VQSDGLGAQEVVTRRNVGWDFDVLLSTVLIQNIVTPDLGGWVISILINLEPEGKKC